MFKYTDLLAGAEDRREAAAYGFAAIPSYEVKGLIIDLDGNKLLKIAIGHHILETRLKIVVSILDDKLILVNVR